MIPRSFPLAPLGAGVHARGTLVYLPRQSAATLTLEQLPPLPAGRVYEVWLIKGSAPQPAGVFQAGGDGSASVIVKGVPTGFDTVAVTEEPGPQGSSSPTSQPLLAGSLSR